MKTQSRRNLIRFVVTLGFMALLAMTYAGPASANQSGGTVGDNAIFQISLCRGLGGIESVDVVRTVGGIQQIKVKCKGGLLDGMNCNNGPFIVPSLCTFDSGAGSPWGNSDDSLPDIQTIPQTVDPSSVDDLDISQDIDPVVEVVDPVVTEEPVIEDEPVDPLPPLVDESPLDQTGQDVDIVDQDQIGGDEPVENLHQIDSNDTVVPFDEIPAEAPILEPAS